MSFDLKLDEGDLRIADNGDLQTVLDTDKLTQDSLKIILTPLRGNKAHPWYGSAINSSLIGQNFDIDFLLDSATAQVRTAMDNLLRMQLQQSLSQVLSPAEAIAAIKDIYINTNPTDRRVLEVMVKILTAAITETEVRFFIRL